MSPVTTFASQTGRTAAATTTTTPLPAFVAGVQADVRGTLVAVHFRDERGFVIFSLEQADGSRTRALGYLPPGVTLRAVVRVGGTWTRHAQFGWQVESLSFGSASTRATFSTICSFLDRRPAFAAKSVMPSSYATCLARRSPNSGQLLTAVTECAA